MDISGLYLEALNDSPPLGSARQLSVLMEDALHANRRLKKSLHVLTDALRGAHVEDVANTLLEECREIFTLLRVTLEQGGSANRLCRTVPRIDLHPPVPAPYCNGDLTRKELQILQLVARGASNDGMARQLFVSESTVRTHLRSINHKLNAVSRTQAVAIARGLGLVA